MAYGGTSRYVRGGASQQQQQQQDSEVPWHVEVLKSQLKFVVGSTGTTLERLATATGCQLEADRPRRGPKTKAIHYGGQTQYLDDEAAESHEKIKIFIRGPAAKRAVAAEVIRGVAKGDDPEEYCGRAMGATVVPHDILHPDGLAWARWRLRSLAHELGVQAHIGKKAVQLSSKASGPLAGELAEKAQVAAEAVVAEAKALTEIVVEAKDALEPEDAPSYPPIAALVDQYGVIVRVSDQDENAVSAVMKLRVVGPADPTFDAAQLLRARFVEGKSTDAVLLFVGQLQAMEPSMAADFDNDLKALMTESGVHIRKGKTALLVTGDKEESVLDAKRTLREMLQFYNSGGCALVQDLLPAVIDKVLEDPDIGVQMTKPSCAVAVDEGERSIWICGGSIATIRSRVNEIARSTPEAQEAIEPHAKKRRTSALSSGM